MGEGLLNRITALAFVLVALAAGCSPLAAGPPAATHKASYTLPPPTPTLSPIGTAAPSRPDRPYTAETIAEELGDVPYNYPAQLRTPAIAEALADALWTYDGRPYRELSFQGSCDEGGARCDLTVSGLPDFVPTRDRSDIYFWSYVPSSGVLTPTGGLGLKGYPPELDPELDALARSLDAEGLLASKGFLGAGWVPPDGLFVLRYGNGLEEGDPTLLVTLDSSNRRIVSITTL